MMCARSGLPAATTMPWRGWCAAGAHQELGCSMSSLATLSAGGGSSGWASPAVSSVRRRWLSLVPMLTLRVHMSQALWQAVWVGRGTRAMPGSGRGAKAPDQGSQPRLPTKAPNPGSQPRLPTKAPNQGSQPRLPTKAPNQGAQPRLTLGKRQARSPRAMTMLQRAGTSIELWARGAVQMAR